MGDRDEIGVSTGEASQAGVSAATLVDQYAVIDLDFRAVIAGVTDAVDELAVAEGVYTFCEAHVDDLVRLRVHMCGIGEGADEAGRVAAAADRRNAERLSSWAV